MALQVNSPLRLRRHMRSGGGHMCQFFFFLVETAMLDFLTGFCRSRWRSRCGCCLWKNAFFPAFLPPATRQVPLEDGNEDCVGSFGSCFQSQARVNFLRVLPFIGYSHATYSDPEPLVFAVHQCVSHLSSAQKCVPASVLRSSLTLAG